MVFFSRTCQSLKTLVLHCIMCNQVLQFKLGNKLRLCNRFFESCAFGYSWTSSGKPYCSCLKIPVSRLHCLPAKDCSPRCRAAGQSTSLSLLEHVAAWALPCPRHCCLNGAGSTWEMAAAFSECFFKTSRWFVPPPSLQVPVPGHSKPAG